MSRRLLSRWDLPNRFPDFFIDNVNLQEALGALNQLSAGL
jgi:hypothetical protein